MLRNMEVPGGRMGPTSNAARANAIVLCGDECNRPRATHPQGQLSIHGALRGPQCPTTRCHVSVASPRNVVVLSGIHECCHAAGSNIPRRHPAAESCGKDCTGGVVRVTGTPHVL